MNIGHGQVLTGISGPVRYGLQCRDIHHGCHFFDKKTSGEHGFDVAGLESYLTEGLAAGKSDGIVIIFEPTTFLLVFLG